MTTGDSALDFIGDFMVYSKDVIYNGYLSKPKGNLRS